jgi:hypothetical protein
MSVTFSGGITFTGGGFSFSAAPPSQATAAWYAITTTQRVVFANDTATAGVRGPMVLNAGQAGSVGTLTDGWWGGAPGAGSPSSATQRVTYATDTATSTTKGNLSQARFGFAGVSDSTTYGWMAGGYTGGPGYLSNVDRITYANDTATASTKGPLSLARYLLGSTSTTSYGWLAGGQASGGSSNSRVDRIDYANDTATASVRGPLGAGVEEMRGSGDTTYGWFAGGKGSPSGDKVSTVNRITYATDTATGVTRGPLSAAKYGASQAGDNTAGWVAGGTYPDFSTIERITYATDTATATPRGPLATTAVRQAANAGQY